MLTLAESIAERIAPPCLLSRPQRRRPDSDGNLRWSRARRERHELRPRAWCGSLSISLHLPVCADFRSSTPSARPRGTRRVAAVPVVDGMVWNVMEGCRGRGRAYPKVRGTPPGRLERGTVISRMNGKLGVLPTRAGGGSRARRLQHLQPAAALKGLFIGAHELAIPLRQESHTCGHLSMTRIPFPSRFPSCRATPGIMRSHDAGTD